MSQRMSFLVLIAWLGAMDCSSSASAQDKDVQAKGEIKLTQHRVIATTLGDQDVDAFTLTVRESAKD